MHEASKRVIRNLLKRLGVDIIHYPRDRVGYKRAQLLHHYGIDLVLDVGANDGGYGKELREFGYQGKLVSFEPLAQPYALLQQLARADDGWVVVNAALGASRTEMQINVAANSSSSSFLPMHDSHRLAAPWAGYIGTEEVTMMRLDDISDSYCEGNVVFLKMDVQGYEQEVLRGGTNTLSVIRGVQLEMSLVPLYEGSWSYRDALDTLLDASFELVSLEPGFYDRSTGRLLQVDGVFMKPDDRGNSA